jgi:hypothetical protein
MVHDFKSDLAVFLLIETRPTFRPITPPLQIHAWKGGGGRPSKARKFLFLRNYSYHDACDKPVSYLESVKRFAVLTLRFRPGRFPNGSAASALRCSNMRRISLGGAMQKVLNVSRNLSQDSDSQRRPSLTP